MNKKVVMRSFFRKYKLQIDIFSAIVFLMLAIIYFIQYSEADGKNMQLFGAIVFGVLSLFKIEEVVAQYRTSRKS